MKTTKKKTLTLLLAVAMILSSFSAVAFAAEVGETPSGSVAIGSFNGGTVTINASNADDSFALYKVVGITYNETSNSVKYAFTSGVEAYLATLPEADRVSVETYQSWADDSTDLKAFLAGYAEYVKKHSVASNYDATATGGTATVNNVALGQYMVLGTGSATGAYIYQIMTATFKPDKDLKVNNAVTLGSKSTLPTLEKAANKDSVSKGDEIEYTLTIGVPTYPVGAKNKSFVVKDVLPGGFDYVTDSQSVTDSQNVAVADGAVTFVADGKNLTWTFDFDKISAQQTVIIKYKVTATDPVITDGNENTAILTYSKSPFGTDVKYDINASKTVYSYELDITKVDSADENIKLAGVVFEVYNSSGDKVATVTTDQDGKATVSGLALGTYRLKETKAATGYADPINFNLTVTLSDEDHDGMLDGKDNTEDTDGVLSVTITNTKGVFNIPTTGDSGTLFFTFAAMELMALAVAMMLVMRRKQARR